MKVIICMTMLYIANFDEWKKLPVEIENLQTSMESIHWNELKRAIPCEIFQTYESNPVQDFRYTFKFKIDKIWNNSERKRLIIRLLWVGNDSDNYISIYPEQRIGSNTEYGLVFHQPVNGTNSPDAYYTKETFSVGQSYDLVVFRDGTTCGFMVFSSNETTPIKTFEAPHWDQTPYNQVSFAKLDIYDNDVFDWSSGQIWAAKIAYSSTLQEYVL